MTIEEKLRDLSAKYNFFMRHTEGTEILCAKNTDGKIVDWIAYNKKEDTYQIKGNTDHLNLWFYETRPDLDADTLLQFTKDLNEALEPESTILIKELIDPEDWQEIAGITDAYMDARYNYDYEKMRGISFMEAMNEEV